MFIFTELMYLSYVRSMDNLYVLLYDCIFNWNTRTSRCDNQSEITAENRNHVHLMQIFRYTLTFLFACLLFTAHWYTHSVTCCPASVPAFWSSGNTNGFRITLSVLVCASLTCLCVVYFIGFSCFPSILVNLLYNTPLEKSSVLVFPWESAV